MKLLRYTTALFAVAACTTPNPSYCPNRNCSDAGNGADALDPTTTIQVATTGNDAADGMTAPVKTLKRGIELATANGAIKTIHLEAGKYGPANGETFPYTVPTGVRILGAPGTAVAGPGAEVGLVVDTGSLESLDFADFATAIQVIGIAEFKHVTVSTSAVGVLADGAANLTATGLSFTATAGATQTGLKAVGSSQVSVNTFVATDTLSVVELDQATVSIAKGMISGRGNISAKGKSLVLKDSQIIGGGGIDLDGGTQLEVTLENTTIADSSSDAIVGRAKTFHMTGGELRNNGRGGAELVGGTYTFTNVGIKGNPVFGIYLQDGSAAPGTISMRGCTIAGNGGDGIYLFAGATGDFGTAANPGTNTFEGNAGVGLNIATSPSAVSAVGNTWLRNTQGSDANGKFPAQLKTGPVNFAAHNNFAIEGSSTLQL
jgi:hypothetical protein